MKRIPKPTPTKSKARAARSSDALAIMDRITGHGRQLRQMIAEEKLNTQIAHMIYEVRTKAGLTQRELAERIGTRQPVVARLESGDYQGHSLTMLQRVARALNRKLRISFVPAKPKGSSRGLARAS